MFFARKRLDALMAENASLKAEVTRLQALIDGGPHPMTPLITLLTKLLAGKEAAIAIAALLAVGNLLKQIQAGKDPDFKDLARVVKANLPFSLAATATEEELASLGQSALRLIKDIRALLI